MSAKDTIDARPETIGSLITFSSTPNTIIIPDYQRFYQWDKSKVIDLLRLTDPDSRDFGFIGTMVFVQAKNNSLEVVDGQQRLLSLVLILCAFRDYIAEYADACDNHAVKRMLGDMLRDIQSENLLVSKSYSDTKDIPRIHFLRSSYESFKELYLSGNRSFIPDEVTLRSELNNFAKNYTQAIEYLRVKYQDHTPENVTSLLDKRLKRLKGLVVNAIYITKPEFAGEVFESINGTGIILKLSELVKNYLFRSASAPAAARKHWDEIESNINYKIDVIEKIIKYDWQNRYEQTEDFEIFRSLKSEVRDVDSYLRRLVRISKIFRFYLQPSVENFAALKIVDNNNDKNHIIKMAATLRVINVKQFLRLIIAVDSVREFVGIKDYVRLIKSIHNFQVRAKISGLATNEVDRLYSKYGKKLQRISAKIEDKELNGKLAAAEVRRILFTEMPAEMSKISSDEVFSTAFKGYARTKSTGKDFFKYLLGTIENHLQKNELYIDVKDNQITLEEVYPQEPSSTWLQTNLASEDIYRLGNATILKGKDNGAGSNKGIEDKYAIYQNSNLKLNEQLTKIIDSHARKWSKEAINDRSTELAKLAPELWKL